MSANSEYKDEHLVKVTQMASANMTETEMIAALGVARSTFYRWKKEKPEFKDAVELGEDIYRSHMLKLGKDAMLGLADVDFKFWKELSKSVPELKDATKAGTTNTQINIDQMNVLNEQSNEELLAYIKSQMEQNPELQHIIEGEIAE